jgi:hypothetical protein
MDKLLDDRVTERRGCGREECGGIHFADEELEFHHRNARGKWWREDFIPTFWWVSKKKSVSMFSERLLPPPLLSLYPFLSLLLSPSPSPSLSLSLSLPPSTPRTTISALRTNERTNAVREFLRKISIKRKRKRERKREKERKRGGRETMVVPSGLVKNISTSVRRTRIRVAISPLISAHVMSSSRLRGFVREIYKRGRGRKREKDLRLL